MTPQPQQDSSAQLLSLDSVRDALEEVSSSSKIEYSQDELETMKEVQRRLHDEDGLDDINPRFIAYTVIVSKNRVDESVKKIRQYLKAVASCDVKTIESDEELWKDPDVAQFLRDYYQPCGVDSAGRQIMWIKGAKPITVAQEKTFIRASTLFVSAIHADSIALREGITFVIDTSKRGRKDEVGNESKLQKINQSYPLRPQNIYLAGASLTMRLVINGLIKIASIFTKQKILERIKFVSVEEAMDLIPKASGPRYLGGGGGGIDDIVEWTKTRYYALPVPDLEEKGTGATATSKSLSSGIWDSNGVVVPESV